MLLPWNKIDTVLLDMDGTLLDLHFDNYFWLEYVPAVYAETNGMTLQKAEKELLKRYKREEGTLNWTDLDFWSDELRLDIPTLKAEIDHLIRVHPHVEHFLQFLQQAEKKIYLVTNAHGKTLDLKMRKTRLGPYFHDIISAHDLGIPKEEPRFWKALNAKIGYQPDRTLLAEDSEANLRSAETNGIRHLIFVAKSSTRDPIQTSTTFPSILYFNELITA